MAHTDKDSRQMAKLSRKINDALLIQPDDGFWRNRWPGMVDRYAEMVEQGVWE